jgi:hypothetical protein
MPNLIYMKTLITTCCLLAGGLLQAQYITGIATRWNDSFSEWEIYAVDEEELSGELRMLWPMRNDWTDWEYRLGEERGRIRLKWRDDFNEWEISAGNMVATARTLWRDNFREWRISNGKQQLTFRCRYGNITDEWEVRDSNYGDFRIYTTWEGDPRDWTVIDELDENIPLTMRMAMVFLATFVSTPKE